MTIFFEGRHIYNANVQKRHEASAKSLCASPRPSLREGLGWGL